MAKFKGHIRGHKAMADKLRRFQQEIPERVGSALYAEAQIEVTEMKRRCPVDTRPNRDYPYVQAPHPGNLRNSIHAEAPEIKWGHISVLVATGMQAPYAIFVHEDPDAFHPVGQWKFMESVINESRPFMGERVAKRLKL